MWYFAGDFLQLTTNVLTYFFYYFSGDCMKTFLLSVLSLFLLPSFCSAQSWQRLDSDLGVLQWADSSTVYIGGTNGCLLRSKDKGITWKQLLLPDSKVQINGIAFSSATTGCAIGGGKIFHTSNRGELWTEVANPTGKYITSIVISPLGIGTAIAYGGAILRSIDNGLTWKIVGTVGASDYGYFRLEFISSTVVLAMNLDKVILSKDGGESFTATILTLPSDSGYTFSDVSISPSGTIIVLARLRIASAQCALFFSSDTGKTWQSASAPTYSNACFFRQDSIGYILSTAEGIQCTKDKGEHYEKQLPGSTKLGDYLTSIRFTSPDIGIAVGKSKKIYRTSNGGEKWDLVSYLWRPENDHFFPVQFVTRDTGFMGAYPTTLYRTSNGGATWLPQLKISYEDGPNFSDQNRISALYFHTTLKGCGFTNGFNKQLYTEDGAETLNAHRGVVADEPKICFLDSAIGAVFSTNERYISQQPLTLFSQAYIGLTHDGGKTWTSSFIDSIGLVSGFYYSPTLLVGAGAIIDSFNSTTYVRSSRGLLLHSTDGGMTWERTVFKEVDYIGSIKAFDEKTYIAVCTKTRNNTNYAYVCRTQDAGKSWTTIDSVIDISIRDMHFLNDTIGYIVGWRGFFMWTADGGKTWKRNRQDSLFEFESVSAVQGGAYMTAQKSIWRVFLPDSLTTSVTEADIDESLAPSVWLRYPRPVPTSGKLQLDAIWVMNLDVSTIKIKLYDMLGIELRDITDSFHSNAGTNTGIVDFDGSALATGIYYIEINGGGYRKAVPVIIAR
jgi:photosystem II stability/assembly factor-like uncharacterized protein